MLRVKVHTNARQERVAQKSADQFEVWVRAKPIEGQANEAVLALLAERLSVPARRLRIMRGASSSSKLIHVLGSV